MRRNRQSLNAFTLVELAVVTAVIGLLASIVLPALWRGGAVARTVLCTNNLREIAKAIDMYVQEHVSHDVAPSWTDKLLPYVDNVQVILYCPEADPVVEEEGGEGGGSFDPEEWDPPMLCDTFQMSTSDWPDWGRASQIVALCDGRQNKGGAGTCVLKFSNTQYQQLAGMGYFQSNGFTLPAAYRNQGAWAYSDDGSDVIWYCFEGWTDYDFEDLRLQAVIDRGAGIATVSCYGRNTGWSKWVVKSDTADEYWPLAYSRPWSVVPGGAPPSEEQLLRKPDWGYYNSATETWQFPIPTGGGGEEGSLTNTNYGMNLAAGRWPRRSRNQIVVLDYYKGYADSVNDEIWERPAAFARHLGRINVLFASGNSKTMAQTQVDFVSAANRDLYW